jgi:uncharacterized Zn-binding protein involved in type VI secretion
MRGVIRLGDATSHGGKVVTGQDKSIVMGGRCLRWRSVYLPYLRSS